MKQPIEQIGNITVFDRTSLAYQEFELDGVSSLLNGDSPSGLNVVRSILTVTAFTDDGKLYQQQIEVDHAHKRMNYQSMILEGEVKQIESVFDHLRHNQVTEYNVLDKDTVAIVSADTELLLKEKS